MILIYFVSDCQYYDERRATIFSLKNYHLLIIVRYRESDKMMTKSVCIKNYKRNSMKNLMTVCALLLYSGTNFQAAENLHKACMQAVLKGDIDMIDQYIQQQEIDINIQDELGLTAFMRAAAHGQLEAMQFLIKLGAHINLQDHAGNTAMLHAVYKRQLQAVQFLIREQADLTLQNSFGSTALMVAVENIDQPIMSILAQEDSNINAQDNCGFTALMVAATLNLHEAVALLLKHGADALLQDNGGWTAFTLAQFQGNTEIAELLKEAQSKHWYNFFS